MAKVAYHEPWHVYIVGSVTPNGWHSGHETQEAANAAAEKANAEANKLGIRTRYIAVANPN